MNDQEWHSHKAKQLLFYFGIFIDYIWASALVIVFALRFLGYYVPEALTSLDFMNSAVGYSFLILSIAYPVRRGAKFWKLSLAINLIIGLLVLVGGVYSVILMEANIFTYLCLIIGAFTIMFNMKNACAFK